MWSESKFRASPYSTDVLSPDWGHQREATSIIAIVTLIRLNQCLFVACRKLKGNFHNKTIDEIECLKTKFEHFVKLAKNFSIATN